MAKALLVHERIPGGRWQPVGVFLGTTNRLDYRMLPGSSGRDMWARMTVANASPPLKGDVWETEERGTWEDWVVWASDALTNGHDMWCTVVEPEGSLDATFERYVLLVDEPEMTPKEFRAPSGGIPELGGYKKVRPS